ncbi:DUF998 domain-containing protein [Halapricum desulfuricans]|uniref:Putative membrane protein, a putative transporter component n=1 Tax=Halapricum desulfuricans TaxID=2841257 RepID=A0A897NJ93_9EURY|nr:DUF998 domain-containing protein [Halapricum desulfuricans]QSG14530.1 putative membrane protein, a putative transporter component [Halapricum desulfuricans]
MGWSARTLGRWAGVASISTVFGAVLLAVVLSPAFALEANALSDLGERSHPASTGLTVIVFNGGLFVGGVLGLLFAGVLSTATARPLSRIGAALFGVAAILLSAIGVFPQGHPLHFPVASGFYTLFSVAVLVFGVGQLRDRDTRSALVSMGAGVGNLAVWTGWITRGGLRQPGLAIPEIAGALFVALWVLVHATGLRSTDRQPDVSVLD